MSAMRFIDISVATYNDGSVLQIVLLDGFVGETDNMGEEPHPCLLATCLRAEIAIMILGKKIA